MNNVQKLLAAFGAVVLLALAFRGVNVTLQNSQGNIDKQVRQACGLNIAIRGGRPIEGEPAVTALNIKDQFRVAGGSIRGRSVHCLVTWDRDERKTGDVMVRWDDSSRSVDL